MTRKRPRRFYRFLKQVSSNPFLKQVSSNSHLSAPKHMYPMYKKKGCVEQTKTKSESTFPLQYSAYITFLPAFTFQTGQFLNWTARHQKGKEKSVSGGINSCGQKQYCKRAIGRGLPQKQHEWLNSTSPSTRASGKTITRRQKDRSNQNSQKKFPIFCQKSFCKCCLGCLKHTYVF